MRIEEVRKELFWFSVRFGCCKVRLLWLRFHPLVMEVVIPNLNDLN